MKINDIISKKDDVLKKDIVDLKKKLEKAKFGVSTREEKNVRVLRNIKKDIARIHTILREREIVEAEKKSTKADSDKLAPKDSGKEDKKSVKKEEK